VIGVTSIMNHIERIHNKHCAQCVTMEVIPDILEITSDIAGETLEKRCGPVMFRCLYIVFLSVLTILDTMTGLLWIRQMWFMMDVTPITRIPPMEFYSFHNGTDYTDFGLGDNQIATLIALFMVIAYGIWLTTSLYSLLFTVCFQTRTSFELMAGHYGELFSIYVHSPFLLLALLRRWTSVSVLYETIKNTTFLKFVVLFLVEIPSFVFSLWTMVLPTYKCVQIIGEEVSYKYNCLLYKTDNAYAIFTAAMSAIVIVKVIIEQIIVWRKQSKVRDPEQRKAWGIAKRAT